LDPCQTSPKPVTVLLLGRQTKPIINCHASLVSHLKQKKRREKGINGKLAFAINPQLNPPMAKLINTAPLMASVMTFLETGNKHITQNQRLLAVQP